MPLRPACTVQSSTGVQRVRRRRIAIGIVYVLKQGDDFIGWTDVGGQYRAETRTLPDGRTLPVSVLANGTAAPPSLLTNPDGYSLPYNSILTAVERRPTTPRQAFR